MIKYLAETGPWDMSLSSSEVNTRFTISLHRKRQESWFHANSLVQREEKEENFMKELLCQQLWLQLPCLSKLNINVLINIELTYCGFCWMVYALSIPTIHWFLSDKHNTRWWKVAELEASLAYHPQMSGAIRSWNQRIIIFTFLNGAGMCSISEGYINSDNFAPQFTIT